VSTSSVQADLDDYLRLHGHQNIGQRIKSHAKDQSTISSYPGVMGKQTADKTENSKKQSLEKYLWFLLLHAEAKNMHRWAEEMTELKLEQIGAVKILDAINSTLAEVPLSEIVKELPDDLQEIVFELHSSQFLLKGAEQVDLDKEWWKTFKQFKQIMTAEQIQTIEVELEKLDQIKNKSEAQLAKQDAVLKKLVPLKR